MMCLARACAAVLLLPTAAYAADEPYRHAMGADLFLSRDAERTSVVKAGLNLDFAYRDRQEFAGIRIEKAWFEPLGQDRRGAQRIYFRGAHGIGRWKANATIGSDGHTLLGSATIHDETKFRKELFVEREIVETPMGVRRGIYFTFAGAAIDLPADDRNVLTLVAGAQEFTGHNVRTHLRATAVHVLNDKGVSLQLRSRYFRNSNPREFDYYSPRWYAQAVPVLQLRRFTRSGWRYLFAGGVGVQRDSNSGWRRSSYFNAQLTSPQRRKWSGSAAISFSETPTTAGQKYDYAQMTLGLTRAW